MKRIATILLIYNLIGISLLYTDWIYKIVIVDLGFLGTYQTERYNVIDFIDTPFYIAWGLYFLKSAFNKFKGMSIFQKQCNYACVVYLMFKYSSIYLITLDFDTFVFWNVFIILTPFILKLERNINWRNE